MTLNIPLVSGTKLPVDFTLTDLGGAAVNLLYVSNIIYRAFDSQGRTILQKHLADSSIAVTVAASGKFTMTYTAEETSPAFAVGSTTDMMTYSHELRIIFDDNQQVLFTGSLIISPTSSWMGDTATAGVDRVVYVQGRY
jgi:hypothetical protein